MTLPAFCTQMLSQSDRENCTHYACGVPLMQTPASLCAIQARTRAMILDYIKHDTCIILAVSPANADIVNSDALELARSVDPQGHRTIGEQPAPSQSTVMHVYRCKILTVEVGMGWVLCCSYRRRLPPVDRCLQQNNTACSNAGDACHTERTV